MSGWRLSLLATVLYFACTVPLGIAVHFASEFAGLAWHDATALLFSPRHAYLAVIAAVAISVTGLAAVGVPAASRRRCLGELIGALPFARHRYGAIASSFFTQFGFFAVTQIGEGAPLAGGDVAGGVAAAVAAALLGSLVIVFGQRRLLQVAATWSWCDRKGRRLAGTATDRTGFVLARARSGRRTPASFRSRPPPLGA